MIFPKKIKLFSIHEVTKATGVSRATLIRLEESGFLKPRLIDENTGYRYYDSQNISAVGQYQRLQDIGFSRKEIADIYYEKVNVDEFLDAQWKKVDKTRRFLKEYALRHDKTKNYSISYITLPAVDCYCVRLKATSLDESAILCYQNYEICIEEGYRVVGSEPLMGIYDKLDPGEITPGPFHEFTYCIPVVPGSGPAEKIRHFPETEALSIIGFGYFSNLNELWERLIKELQVRELEPAGPPRVIALVAPYSGAHIKPTDYCYECAIPVRDKQ